MCNKSNFNLVLIVIILIFSWTISQLTAKIITCTDFPIFYYAASTIMDKDTPNHAVYEIDHANKYNIPEPRPSHIDFIYSIAAAYILSPLALMPYYTAKSVMIFMNILMYLGGVSIALRLGRAKGQTFFFLLTLSILWMPFIKNMRFGQINAILFFLISVSVLFAAKNKPIWCGILLGTAALFKLFPLAIAMILGLKNWRIFVACALFIGCSLLIPGSMQWFSVIGNIYPAGYTPIYLWLKQFGIIWYLCYAGSIAGITALIVSRSKEISYPIIASFGIPAMFLSMPLVQYYHLTILMFSFAYLSAISLADISQKSNIVLLVSIILAIEVIQIQLPFSRLFGLFLLWIVLAFLLTFRIIGVLKVNH
jgi:hypothetical protein